LENEAGFHNGEDRITLVLVGFLVVIFFFFLSEVHIVRFYVFFFLRPFSFASVLEEGDFPLVRL